MATFCCSHTVSSGRPSNGASRLRKGRGPRRPGGPGSGTCRAALKVLHGGPATTEHTRPISQSSTNSRNKVASSKSRSG
eukprot:5091260-Lingulodinium_polyedra.AAC.1